MKAASVGSPCPEAHARHTDNLGTLQLLENARVSNQPNRNQHHTAARDTSTSCATGLHSDGLHGQGVLRVRHS